ncbi:transcriptional regulator [Polymorphobacter fuscus]|uniref:Transcriptional regulator n=2 Tax=Sandarakinorhabdus fusca TaxID=1439888 RepID=A0A7C9GNR1_9SPHN|nr:transcriptional regulator [Polymorphobacter fuscus]MQT16937.1 transcriptional regulator [Polymorphobacter fuscus]
MVGLAVTDKAALLAAMAERAAAAAGLSADTILEHVLLREALGSTGFGGGAAIPHARIEALSGIIVVVASLAAPLDFAALDGEPVDIAVLMLSPQAAGADHLKALARISRTLRDPARLDAMRAAGSATALRRALAVVEEASRRAA